MDKPTLSERLRYRFDRTMSRGTLALIAWLFIIAATVILVTAFALRLVGRSTQASLGEQIWAFVMLTLEPDAVTFDHWTIRLATLVVVFTSIFVLSSLIGILTSGIETKMADLRRGRSKVIEQNHTVILGWTPQIFPIIDELVEANANKRKSVVVVLGNRDKLEMQDEISDKVGKTGKTQIVVRRGDPLDMSDLGIVSLNTSKSIIILTPPGEEGDARVIKTLLAITKRPQRREAAYHIVTAVRRKQNLEVANIVAGEEAEVILTGDLIARIAAQTVRQSGLSSVYSELLDFAGDEIYFHEEPKLVGKSFGDALMAYEDSVVIGLHASNGSHPDLKPSMDTEIESGDQIIAISRDDDTVRLSGMDHVPVDADSIQATLLDDSAPEHTLILGWNRRAGRMIHELDHYVTPGSSLTLVADLPDDELDEAVRTIGLVNQRFSYSSGDTTDRRTLEELNLEIYDHVLLLSYLDGVETQAADAKTLMTLLHLRQLADRENLRFSIVSEILDMRNRELAEATKPDDFIVSDRLVSFILSQLSQNKALAPLFTDLFGPIGSEIYIRPASSYVSLETDLNFYTVVESARRRGEVAIGYMQHFNEVGVGSTEVSLNPAKSATFRLSEGDEIIVLAEG